jgi:Ser/Thr protein kinase RdoA (MazF antagonist)
MDQQPGVDDALAAPFTRLDAGRAAQIASVLYGIEPDGVRRFDTERDDTFLISGDGGQHVLKVANPADDVVLIDMQLAALAHVAQADPQFPVPHGVVDVEGRTWSWVVGAGGERRIVRLLTFLPGRTLDYDLADGPRREAVGAAAGRLSRAMSGFEHPGSERVLAWDLQHLGRLREHLRYIADDAEREDVAAELDRFDATTGPALAAVRHHVVHNDLNMDNVVVDDDGWVSGILDFGDMVRTAVVADLAVAMAYAVPSVDALADPGLDPWATAFDLAAGYVRERPLTGAELDLLPHLVRARMAQRMLVNSWLAATNPGNSHHTLRSNGHAIAALRRLVDVDPPVLVPGA